MAIGTCHMNWFLALLGLRSLSNLFLYLPRIRIFLMDHTDFYLNVLLPLIFSWTFMLHCLRGQTRAMPVQIHCQSYASGAGAACPWPPARPNSPESGFHAYITICYIPEPISRLVVALSHLRLPYHTFLLVHHRKFMLYIRKSTI